MSKKKKKNKRKKQIYAAQRTTVITHCALMLVVFLMFSYALFFFLTNDDPSKDSLVYEDCTFITYKFIDKKQKYYNIYVDEYDIPLEIDNIVFDRTNVNALQNLKKGDSVTVSLRPFKDTFTIYEMYCAENYILSYEDYLNAHSENADGMIKISTIFIILSSGMIITEIIYFKKTGKVLPWPRRY